MKEKELKDNELETVTGAGEYIEFVDSDDYQEKETYETAYKYSKKEDFAEREISPLINRNKALK